MKSPDKEKKFKKQKQQSYFTNMTHKLYTLNRGKTVDNYVESVDLTIENQCQSCGLGYPHKNICG